MPHPFLYSATFFALAFFAAPPASAQPFTTTYAAPWLEEETSSVQGEKPPETEEIDPRPLTLKDLEKLATFGRESHTAPLPSLSPVENLYSQRAKEELALFGYDLFQTGEKPSKRLPAGMVQDGYILGNGDRLEIMVRGQENARKTYEINSEGILVTDNFGAFPAAGKTLKGLRAALEQEAATLHNVQIDVSVKGARQIDVLVIGDVSKPGRKTLTPFHTVLDALQEAEGIRKTGSLRRIKLVRGGKSEFIDLYNVLIQGAASADRPLQDGDRIIVPPIGPTVAISGTVKRPAIYELRKGERLSTLEMLGLAGGVLAPGNNRFMRLALNADGQETVEEVDEPAQKLFGDGGLLTVAQAQEKRAKNITLSGHTREPGEHALEKAKTLAELIKSEQVFGDALYPLIGVIERRDPKTLTKTLIEFSPRQVVEKNSDMPLAEGDDVHLFSLEQIRNLRKKDADEDLLKNVAYAKEEKEQEEMDGLVASFLEERAVFVRGAVRQPGAYPVAAGTTLEAMISVTGGTTVEADPEKIEVTSRLIPADEEDEALGTGRRTASLSSFQDKSLVIAPGDTVRVAQKFNRVEEQSVTLLGEVKNPGKYDLLPGDTMLTLLKRAGGLAPTAYPDGVIFSRASERKQEENRYKSQARDLEMKLAEALRQEDKDKKPDMTQVGAAQAIIAELKNAKAVGRITVEADPSILASDKEQDILLEAGDKIYIPRRPLTVRVGGEVQSPAALQFRKGKNADTYIDEAGGPTYFADMDRAFVVYPDGSAKPLSVSAWKQGITMIPPGSTIIVPRDPKPFDFIEGAEKISTILANIALTGFYIDDLSDNDN
jgi:polysaccharide export outer membrane protein